MPFYWGLNVTILFDFWKIPADGTGAFLGSLVILFAAGVLSQWVQALRSRREALLQKQRETLRADSVSDDYQLQEEYDAKRTSAAAAYAWIPSPMTVFRSGAPAACSHLLNSLIYIVQSGISYLLMLAFMSFNGGVFIAIVLGFGFGYFLFGLPPLPTASNARLLPRVGGARH